MEERGGDLNLPLPLTVADVISISHRVLELPGRMHIGRGCRSGHVEVLVSDAVLALLHLWLAEAEANLAKVRSALALAEEKEAILADAKEIATMEGLDQELKQRLLRRLMALADMGRTDG